MAEEMNGLISFYASHHAIRAEKVLQEAGFQVTLIPGPRELSPNCGVALRFVYARSEAALTILSRHKVQIEAVHEYRPRVAEMERGKWKGERGIHSPFSILRFPFSVGEGMIPVTTQRITQVRAGRRAGAMRVSALTWGVVAGLLAVVAGTFFAVRPPEAYGICMACHGRDLVNWGINHLLNADLTVAGASIVFPLLTTVGVLIGAFVGAVASGEFHWQVLDNPLKTFVYGVLVMNFALVAAGCSIRLALRAAAGEFLGLVGFGAFIGGAALATLWLKREALR